MTPTNRGSGPWNFHPQRDQLMAEAHARPSTPAAAPLLAARIATMSGEAGAEIDRLHMAALCRKLGVAEPGPNARWCVVDGGAWRLRWERHTEVSTWTVFRPHPDGDKTNFAETALDLAPQDWLGALPGEVLVAAHVALVRTAPASMVFAEEDVIASAVAGGAIEVFTDFRAGPDGFTRFILIDKQAGPVLAGRVLQQLFEIETYRLLALLAFPEATAGAQYLAGLERDAADAAYRVAEEGGVAADRDLLARLAAMAGEAESLAAGASYRFAAARAYHGLVQERIRQLNEQPLGGRPTIGDFMERRLAPAMRTCAATAERQHEAIARIARTTQMLSTRVDVAAEATTAGLLASMDRRAQLQLRVQETVEGLSAAAISYYALGLLHFVIEGATAFYPRLNANLLTGLAAPLVVYLVWRFLKRIRAQIQSHHAGGDPVPSPAPSSQTEDRP